MRTATRVGATSVLVTAGLLALVLSYAYGGGAGAGSVDLSGPAVRWALPVSKFLVNLAAACTVGPIALAAFALPQREPARRAALRLAGWAAAAWSAGALAYTAANFLFIANRPVSAGLDTAFLTFLTTIDAGRAGVATAAIAGAAALCCFRASSPGAVAATLLLALSGLVPVVLKSHAASGAGHADSTAGVVTHSAAAAVWIGGLLALLLLRPLLPGMRLATTARRYSTLALACFICLAASGVLAAGAQISSPTDLLSPYGGILVAKTAALIVLGLFGALHRQRVLTRLEKQPQGRRNFLVLAAAELAVMGAASGMAAALARTAPPAAAGSRTAPLPALDAWGYISRWSLDPIWVLGCGFGVFFYLAGIRRLRSTGTPWPVYRTIAWLGGIALLFAVTNGGLRLDQQLVFSSQILTQMILTAVVPLLLVPAAPLTLARLTIRPRTDGSCGVKEFLNGPVQRTLLTPASDPVTAAILLTAAPIAFYSTPLLAWSADSQLAYTAAAVLALLPGCLFTMAVLQAPSAGSKSGPVSLAMAAAAVLFAVYGWRSGGMELASTTAENTADGVNLTGSPWESPAAIIIWLTAGAALCIIGTATALRQHRAPKVQAQLPSPQGATPHGRMPASTKLPPKPDDVSMVR